MSATASFRLHHKELLEIAGEISRSLRPEVVGKDAQGVRMLLSKLSGKLSIHLAMEDNSLYPRLLSHKDPTIKGTADRFIAEMGNIKTVYLEYTKKWSDNAVIQQGCNDFIKETKAVFGALAKRMEKEDKELYNLVDKCG